LWSKYTHQTISVSEETTTATYAMTDNDDNGDDDNVCGVLDVRQYCHDNNQNKKIIETDNLPSLQTGGILRPCIQFLNIDSSHAVRLFTPPFEKLETTPLTVFCVAIATEDGCFFSGLKKKMEMGHICGDISEDRSPICLNADYIDQRKGGNEENCSSMHSMSSGVCNYHDCHQRNSDHTSDVYSGSDYKEDVEDTKEACDNIVRGQLGPGMWHCYVAVFDGEKSVIRIDGVEESLTYDSMISPSFLACLDGITIGSDHDFDMSLCFGQGSDGEGEGAISGEKRSTYCNYRCRITLYYYDNGYIYEAQAYW